MIHTHAIGQKAKVSRFERWSGNRRMNGWTEAIALPPMLM